MTRESKEMTVGALVMTGLMAVLVYSYGKTDIAADGGYVLNATFNRVDGLVVGDDVQLGGVSIGRVAGMSLDKNYRAVLRLLVADGIKIPDDTAVAIHTDGLFGSKFVVLDPGGSEKYLKPGDNLSYTQDAVLVDELLELIIAQGKAKRNKKAGADAKPAGGGK